MKKTEYICLALGLLLCVFVYKEYFYKKTFCVFTAETKITPEHFNGDWIGFEESDKNYYCLKLSTNYPGSLAKVSAELGITNYYIITNWIVRSNQAVCKFADSTNLDDPSDLVCSINYYPTLDGFIQGKRYGGWSEHINFRRKGNLETNLLLLEKMNDTSKP